MFYGSAIFKNKLNYSGK